MTRSPTMRAGGDAASAAANGLATTGRVLPVVTDRLFHITTAGASTMPLTSPARAGMVRSSRASNHSEYTLFSPSDCPTNQDHLKPRMPRHAHDVAKWVARAVQD